MATDSFGERHQRKELLRAVYEDNLRIERNDWPASKPKRAVPDPVRRRPWLGVVALVLTIALAGVVYQGVAAEQPAPRVPAQRVALLDSTLFDSAAYAVVPPPPPPADLDSLTLAELYGLEVRTIVIDPGHGGRDPGAIGPTGLTEKEVTFDVARRLRDRLVRRGFEVRLTRDTDVKVPLRERVAFARDHDADLFVSLHVNYLPEEPVTSVETYYFGAQAADRTALQLAERENRDSEYSVAEFNDLLQEIGPVMKLQESKRLAESIQKHLYRNIRAVNREVDDWGVKRAPFVVLLGQTTPSVLAEITCISNRAEEAKLSTPTYRERIAASLDEGIAAYLKHDASQNEISDGAPTYATED